MNQPAARRPPRWLALPAAVVSWAAVAAAGSAPEPPPGTLSPFARAKAEELLRRKLACLACHELDGQGGRLGPSLSALRTAQQPDYVRAKIEDPRRITPSSVMPRPVESRATLALVARYLSERDPVPPLPYEPIAPAAAPGSKAAATPAEEDGAALYRRWCAGCHGEHGRGDGPNARFLPVRPGAHADGKSTSRRSDDWLFDMIAGGGAVMNRSPLMPAYGATFRAAEIRALVRHIRDLCRCEGPEWSRDVPPGGRP